MDLIQFIKENLPADYQFQITQDLSFRFDKNSDNVVLKIQQGNRYKRGVIMPITINITSKDVSNSRQLWEQFVKNVSDENYLEGQINYYMLFMTPSIIQVFDEISNNYYSVINIMGTIVETDSVNDVIKMEVKIGSSDYINLEIITLPISWTSTFSTEQYGVSNTMHSYAMSSVASFSVSTYIEDNLFFNTLFRMRQGNVSNDTIFNVRLTWQNGDIESYNARVSRQAFLKNRGELSVMTIDFMV